MKEKRISPINWDNVKPGDTLLLHPNLYNMSYIPKGVSSQMGDLAKKGFKFTFVRLGMLETRVYTDRTVSFYSVYVATDKRAVWSWTSPMFGTHIPQQVEYVDPRPKPKKKEKEHWWYMCVAGKFKYKKLSELSIEELRHENARAASLNRYCVSGMNNFTKHTRKSWLRIIRQEIAKRNKLTVKAEEVPVAKAVTSGWF